MLFARILPWKIFLHPLSEFSAKHLFSGGGAWLEIVTKADEQGVLSSHSSAEKLNPALSFHIQCQRGRLVEFEMRHTISPV